MEKSEIQLVRDALENTVVPLLKAGNTRALPDSQANRKSENQYFELKTHPMQSHDHFEWLWLLSGSAQLKLNDAIYEMEVGDFCLLPPLFSHCDIYDRDTPPYQSLWFAYYPGRVHFRLFDYQPIGDWKLLADCALVGVPAVGTVLALLQKEITEDSPFRSQALQNLLLYLAHLLLRSLETVYTLDSQSLSGRVASQVIGYLHTHYAHQITLNDIAGEVHLNPNHLAAVFKKETGQTIFNVLTQIRIERAAGLILEGRLPLHEIAGAVGYNSVDRFSRNFRSLKGLPPSRYGA